ncbi:MAG: hypothetical protein MK554_16145 [Planctomycetes bacterium]|nr:hypothetical protein [Planctomycetota bacterium]
MNKTDTHMPSDKEPGPTPEEELVAYLDGELDAHDVERVEALLAESPELRAALEQHKAIAKAIATPRTEDGEDAERTLAQIRQRLDRSRRTVFVGFLAAAAALILAVLIGARLITGVQDDTTGQPIAAGRPPVAAPQQEVIADLDVLEILQEEGGEISLELVNLLLEDDSGTGVLDSGLFDEWLEEEISWEKF